MEVDSERNLLFNRWYMTDEESKLLAMSDRIHECDKSPGDIPKSFAREKWSFLRHLCFGPPLKLSQSCRKCCRVDLAVGLLHP